MLSRVKHIFVDVRGFECIECKQREQIHRDFRKPLIVMSPKNLLRHQQCRSTLSEFDDVEGDKQGTRFKRLIKDIADHKDKEDNIRRLVLCSGKVRTQTSWTNVVAIRMASFC
jgi:2-oxoglutarate dehydrogenase complex dehydrogenase (E1) component-like enzyme